jgi:hypothetical protein
MKYSEINLRKYLLRTYSVAGIVAILEVSGVREP